MTHNKTYFSLLLKHLPRRQFREIVERHQGDKSSKGFTCWDQFIGMLFGQLSNCGSLRDTVTQYNTFDHIHYHLGSRDIARSTLSDANKSRPAAIFQDLFEAVLSRAQTLLPVQQVDEMVKVIDATEIALPQSLRCDFPRQKQQAGLKIHTIFCLDQQIPQEVIVKPGLSSDLTVAKQEIEIEKGKVYVFDRAYCQHEWWAKIEARQAKFVTRPRKGVKLNFVRNHSHPQAPDILEDQVIRLNQRLSHSRKNPYQKELRVVIVKDEQGKPFKLITNDFDSSAERISELYRKRWQIEIFFKWIKQNLKIKKFFGRCENAMKTQIYIAMIAYLLLRLTHSALPIKHKFIEFVRILKAQIMSRGDCLKAFKRIKPKPKRPSNQITMGFCA